MISIVTVGLFVFTTKPNISVEEVWGYIMKYLPPI
jgi:hypothetical protein